MSLFSIIRTRQQRLEEKVGGLVDLLQRDEQTLNRYSERLHDLDVHMASAFYKIGEHEAILNRLTWRDGKLEEG